MPLPKRHAEAGRVSLYYGSFYFTDEAGDGPQEEGANGVCRGRSTTSGKGCIASQQIDGQHKANELARLCESTEPENWRPATDVVSMLLPVTTIVTGE